MSLQSLEILLLTHRPTDACAKNEYLNHTLNLCGLTMTFLYISSSGSSLTRDTAVDVHRILCQQYLNPHIIKSLMKYVCNQLHPL